MNAKNVIVFLAVVIVLVAGGIWLKKAHNVQTLKTVNPQTTPAVDATAQNAPDTSAGAPSSNVDTAAGIAEKPAFAENPIKNDATAEGFKIADALVENNVDLVTKKPVNDHLELSLQNISGKNITDFEIYYTITDPASNIKEGYYKKLSGFVLKSGETKSIHFDNGTGDGHFSENLNSIYRTTNPVKVFDVMLSSPGYKIETAQINKDPGGAEKAD